MTNVPASTGAPLAPTLARASVHDPSLTADLGTLEAGWFPAAALLAPGSPELAEGLERSVAAHPGAERRVAGSFFASSYTRCLAGVAVLAYLSEARVPDLSIENIALRYLSYTWYEDDESGEGERIDLRFLSGRFAALPDDPAAGHRDAQIVPDGEALRTLLHTSIAAHLTPLFTAVQAQTSLGLRAQWCQAADELAVLFLQGGQSLGDEARGMAEGLACVKAPGSPLLNRDTGYITIELGGHREVFRAHGGCCLYYRLKPGEHCSTCVLLPPAERIGRLRSYLAHKHKLAVS